MKRNTTQQPNYIFRYGMRHVQAGLNSLGQLSRVPLTTFITCLVIGITLALPTALFVLLKNVDVLGQTLQQSTQMTLYMKPETPTQAVQQLVGELKNNNAITTVHSISPSEGLQELQQQSGVKDMLSELQDNPLPWALVISPAKNHQTSEALAQLSSRLKQYDNVAAVQLDSTWIERLFAVLTLAHRTTYALAFFLGMAVLLIVNNCIRATTQLHKKEIEIVKLIGGTHAFIRRPFLYAGMVYGLLGGIVAWQLVDLFLLWIENPVHHLVGLYNSSFQLMGLNLADTLLLLGSSMMLGWIGSWFATTRYLRSRRF